MPLPTQQIQPRNRADIFLCVSCCRDTLKIQGDNLVCPECNATYVVRGRVPILLPPYEQQAAVKTKETQAISLSQIQSVYDRVYEHDGLMGTDLDVTYDRVTKQILLSFAAPLAGTRLLDLGTGIGNLWQYVAADIDGYAFDISTTGARKALERFPHLTVSVSIAEYIPYLDGFFDAVLAADTLEHTFSPNRSLEEIYRVLRSGGILAASFPIPNSLRKWGYNRFLRQRPDFRLLFKLVRVLIKRTLIFGRPDFQPIDRDYTADQWVHLLEQTGFRVDQVVEWPEAPKLPIVTLIKAVRG